MNEPKIIDHSDDLARVSALVSLLTDFDPNGKWKEHPLFKKWRRSRYSLSVKQFATMTAFLEAEWNRVKPQPKAKIYVQIDLFE